MNYHKNKRFKKLDEVVFASDVVGEMEPPGLCMGPFKAYHRDGSLKVR